MKTPFAETRASEREGGDRRLHSSRASRLGCRTILFISQDKRLHEDLRVRANTIGYLVVKAERPAGTVAVLKATRPDAVLLDLDLPDEAAWQIAELLLNEPGCPPVLLLTARVDQFDLQTAVRAGVLVSKSESPGRLIEIIEQTLALPEANQPERNAIQRVVIRSLRPSAWAEATAPAYRFWGINE